MNGDESNKALAPLSPSGPDSRIVEFRTKWCEGVMYKPGPSMLSDSSKTDVVTENLFERVRNSYYLRIQP